MKRAGQFLLSAVAVLVPTAVAAFEIGYADYRWLSDLTKDGYEPFASSGATGDVFGMAKGAEYYLCYPSDIDIAAQMRRDQMRSEVNGGVADRKVQSVPIACVLLR